MSAFDNLAKIFESRSNMEPLPVWYKDHTEAGDEVVTWREDGKKLKGGLVDRSLLSWLRIIGVTVLWWAALVGFLCTCFFLAELVLGSRREGLPFLIDLPFQGEGFRIKNNILQQPGLAMACDRREKTCNITLNRLLLWEPETFKLEDNHEMEREGRTWNLKEELKKLGHGDFLTYEPAVFVTCYGVRSKMQERLEGMKLDRPGFKASGFPWSGNVEEEKQMVVLSLVKSRINLVYEEEEVTLSLVCQAWADNIRTKGFPVRINDLSLLSTSQPRHTMSRNGAVTKWICFKGWEMGEAEGEMKDCNYDNKD